MPQQAQSDGKKRADLSFGQIAIREQFVSPDRVLECLEIQRKLQGLDLESKRIGEILIEKGYLTRDQAGRIAEIQAQKKPSSDTRPARSQNKKPPAIPGYEILEVVGRGANGVVYRARQVSMDRMVAIKVLAKKQGTDKGFVERFIREAQVVAKLNHENIILGIDVGESQGLHYFVMEFVDGQPVSSILKKEGRLDEKRTIQIALPILKALSHAREHDLVHRDVKPENIMIAQNGVAKLCDLGLAKQTQEGGADLTREGISVGTPNYISPEQARGESEIDIRSDIYSLGASLYHMVTGSTVFTGPNPMVIMTKHVTDKPDAPIKRYDGVSPGLNAVIVKMMQKRREDRYQTPESVMKDLEAILSGNSPSVLVGKGKVTRRVQPQSDISPAIRTRRRVPKKTVPPMVPIFACIAVVALLAFLFFPKGGGTEDPVQKPPVNTKKKAPKKPAGTLDSAKKNFESDEKTFREWWGGKISAMKGAWIQEIYARGEKYLRKHEMTATEQRMVDLVQESRGKVDEIILSRIWNDHKQQADKAIEKGAYAEAIQMVESIGAAYLHFQTDPKKVLTEAGVLQQKYLQTLREETIPQAYLVDLKRIEKTSGIEPYVLISEMIVQYGSEKRSELAQLRKTRFMNDMRGYLAAPLTEKKLGEASSFLATLSKKWPGDVDLQSEIRREEASLKKAREDWIRNSGALAANLYANTFLVPFEGALGRRDLLAARAQLHEVYFGKVYQEASPSILVGQMEKSLLGAILNPDRVAPLDYAASIRAVEKVAREAKGFLKNSAVDYYFSLRTYLLLEQFFNSASEGVSLQNGDSRKFGRYSAELRKTQNAVLFPRKTGSPWKMKVTQKASGGGSLVKELFLAPNQASSVDESDLVLLAKRKNIKTWKTDAYFFLQAGILYLYAGKGSEAREWFDQVKGVDAGFELNRFLDRIMNAPDANLEETARTKFKQASKLIARETKKALLLCHELEALYSKTEWMTTLVDEKGRPMKKSRIDLVLFWIQQLEGAPKEAPKKADGEQGIFRGDVRFQGNRMEADYDFSREGMEADFAPSWYQERLRVEQKENGVRLWGRGTWYWKAPLKGDVVIEMDIVANSDQAIGAAVHGEGFERGYIAIADMEGDGAWRPLEGQSILYKQPVSARNWNEQYLDGGSKSVRFQKGRSYKIRLERKGTQILLQVGNIRAVSGQDDEYNEGKIGIVLSHSDIVVKRLKVVSQIDEDWLREEEDRLKK